MHMKKRRVFLVSLIILFGLLSSPVFSAESGDMDLDLNMGVTYSSNEATGQTALGISLKPDISFGKWGIGLIGTLNFSLDDESDSFIRFISEDWVPDFEDDENFIDYTKTAASLYLPIFRYVRYGWKGEPLYAQFGTIDSISLGTGVFVNQYSNTALYEQQRISGAVLDIDGSLFNFPYIGFESFASNITEFDVLGARVYSRPLSFLEVPIVNGIQIGASFAADRNPAALDDVVSDYFDTTTFSESPDIVTMYGADIVVPLLPFSLFSMDLFGDLAFQPSQDENDETASALRSGVRGKIGGLINYMADFTMPKKGYKPYYFDDDYDLNRKDKYDDPGLSDDSYYLMGSAGFDLFDENLVFDLRISSEVVAEDFTLRDDTPKMEAYFKLGEDILPLFYFDAYYRKTSLSSDSFNSFLEGVMDPTTSAEIEIDANIQYSVIKTQVGMIVTYDSSGNREIKTSIAGDLTLDELLGIF